MSLVNIQNTNFENGITNRNAAALFGSMGHLDPTKFNTFMDDFNAPNIVSDQLDGFSDALTGTVAAADLDGGAIVLATGGTDTNVNIIQAESLGFSVVASRPLYFRGKLETDVEVDSDVVVGLMDAVADVTPTDGIQFIKADGADTVDIQVFSTTLVASAVAIATMVPDVQQTFEFYWDGIDRVYYGVDGVALGFVDLAGLTLPTGLLAPTVGAITGDTAVVSVTCDYLFASQER